MPIQDIRFVTAEEAKAFIVMPNSRVLLIDRSGMAYLKTADNMGQSQTQCFRFEAVNADGTPVKPQDQPTQPDFKDFVKMNDIGNFGFVTVDDLKKFGFVTNEQFQILVKKFDEVQGRLDRARATTAPKQPQ
jgi:hypothetical protein